jgi:hypothetical protein
VYFKLVIDATAPVTELWLGDDAGYLVQKEVGGLRTSLWPGHYVVEFGRGTSSYPIHLVKASRSAQTALEAGSTCARLMPQLLPE